MSHNVTILLVEDDIVDVKLVKKSLMDENISSPLVVAENGAVALDMLRGGSHFCVSKPYLILLDINMPLMNGHEFLKEIREDEKLKESIVFILTTSQDSKDIETAYKHNVAGYMLKHKIGTTFTQKIQLLSNYLMTVEFPPVV